MGWKTASYSAFFAVMFSFIAVFIASLIVLDEAFNSGFFGLVYLPTDAVLGLMKANLSFLENVSELAVELFIFAFTFVVYFLGGMIVGGVVGKVINQVGIWELKRSIGK